jgi:hypothetical protein
MRIVSKLGVSLFAVALVIGFSSKSFAADAKKDTGTIKATVTGKDGKPAANVAVRVLPQGKKPAAAANSDGKTVEVLAPAAGRPTPVAEGMTNDKGVAEIKDVPVGDYAVAAGSKDAGMGRANASVKKGETVEVSITLKERAAK